MTQRYKGSGDIIDYTVAGSDAVAGDFRVSGVHVVHVLEPGAVGAVVPASVKGRFRATTDTGAAWAAGARVYLHASNANQFTTTASGNTFAGFAAEAKLSGATTCDIVLAGPGMP